MTAEGKQSPDSLSRCNHRRRRVSNPWPISLSRTQYRRMVTSFGCSWKSPTADILHAWNGFTHVVYLFPLQFRARVWFLFFIRPFKRTCFFFGQQSKDVGWLAVAGTNLKGHMERLYTTQIYILKNEQEKNSLAKSMKSRKNNLNL